MAFKKFHSILFLTSILFLNSIAYGLADTNYFGFHPSSPLALGAGFSPNDLAVSRMRCVTFIPRSEKTSAAAYIDTFLVRNLQELKQVLRVDPDLDASFLSFEGGASFNLNENHLFRRDSLTFVVLSVSETGRVVLDKPLLIPYAQKLLDDQKFDQFERDCGSHIVNMERRGAIVGVLITLENLSDAEKNSLLLKASEGQGFGPLKTRMRHTFQKYLTRLNRNASVSVQIVSTHGNTVGDLRNRVLEYFWDSNSVEKIETSLAETCKKFTADSSVAIGYHTAMFGFGFRRPRSDDWDESKRRGLARITAEYRKVTQTLDELNGILAGTDPRSFLVDSSELEDLRVSIPYLEEYQDSLSDAHSACRKNQTNDDCRVPKRLVSEFRIPELPEPPTLEDTSRFFLGLGPAINSKTTLYVRGTLVKKVEILLDSKVIAVQDVMPIEGGDTELVPVNLSIFWEKRKPRKTGLVTGALRITDYFGRKVQRTFYSALHSYEGSDLPGYEKFSPAGKL